MANPTLLSKLLPESAVISHEIEGVKLKFAPITINALAEIKPLANKLARLFLVFTDGSDRSGSIQTVKPDGTKEIAVAAADVELMDKKLTLKQEAIADLINSLLDPVSLGSVLNCILNSLRHESERPSLTDLQNNITPDLLFKLLHGVYKANVSTFSQDKMGSVGKALRNLETVGS